MPHRYLLALACLCLTSSYALADDPQSEWQPLLSQDLSENWELWYGRGHKSVHVPGYPNRAIADDDKWAEPIGLIDIKKDPLGIVSIQEEYGKPVLRISGQVFGGINTKEEFENYHLSLQFKWGEQKWAPRANAKRDSGLLLHSVGKHGDVWGDWMSSVESQIQEGDCGDLYLLPGTSATTRGRDIGGKKPIYDVASSKTNHGNVIHAPSEEKPHGEWNTSEAYVVGDDMVFVVNGRPVMAPLDCTYRGKPLTKGKIQIQSEGAEVYYRDIKIRPIKEFPAELAEHVRPVE